MRVRKLPLALALAFTLLGSGCGSEAPTSSDHAAPAAPSHDGTGWMGGGGRMPGDTTSTGTQSQPDPTQP